jgi:hypothetical protein
VVGGAVAALAIGIVAWLRAPDADDGPLAAA